MRIIFITICIYEDDLDDNDVDVDDDNDDNNDDDDNHCRQQTQRVVSLGTASFSSSRFFLRLMKTGCTTKFYYIL